VWERSKHASRGHLGVSTYPPACPSTYPPTCPSTYPPACPRTYPLAGTSTYPATGPSPPTLKSALAIMEWASCAAPLECVPSESFRFCRRRRGEAGGGYCQCKRVVKEAMKEARATRLVLPCR
jgi:hypothetical protein